MDCLSELSDEGLNQGHFGIQDFEHVGRDVLVVLELLLGVEERGEGKGDVILNLSEDMLIVVGSRLLL